MSILKSMLLLTATLGAVGCADALTGPQPGTGDAQFTVLNALSAGADLKLNLDGELYPIPSPGASASIPIPPGSHQLEARAIDGRLLTRTTFAVASGGRRTAVVAGPMTGVVLLVAADTASLPPTNATKIRVVHSAEGSPPLDAFLVPAGDSPDSTSWLVRPLLFGTGASAQFPGYAIRPPGTYDVVVTRSGTTTPSLATVRLAATSGQVWSVVLAWSDQHALQLHPVLEGGQTLRQVR